MTDFSKLTLNEMIRPEGYDCDCGKHHVCPIAYLNISKGAINAAPEMIKALGKKKPFIVCDANTYAAAGEKATKLFDAAGIPYVLHMLPAKRPSPAEWEVGSVIMHFDQSCDMFLAVGSGVINDICKVAALATNRISAVIGTAPSMDGYASNSSSMEVDHVKVTLYNHGPIGILLDSEILAQAPMRMLWAGLGDMVAKYIAVCEWRISHLVTGEYYCEAIAELMRTALRKMMSAADGIAVRDPDAIQTIAEGLVIAGIAMAYAEVSRPASGLEHYFSHMWEMMALERGEAYDLHGIQVGVGTLLTMKLYRKIAELTPNRAKAEAHMAAYSREAWEAQVNRIFGKTAGAIVAIENKAGKNDPVRHAQRLNKLIDHWDEILQIMREELPDYDWLHDAMAKTGMPLTPADIDISMKDTIDAFLGSRDIRDKYLSCSFLWDLGETDEFAEYLQQVANA